MIKQYVRQRVPDQWISHRERPSTKHTQPVPRSDEKLTTGRSRVPLWCSVWDWHAVLRQVLRRLTTHTVEHHDAKLEHSSVGNIEPIQFQSERAATNHDQILLSGASDHTGSSRLELVLQKRCPHSAVLAIVLWLHVNFWNLHYFVLISFAPTVAIWVNAIKHPVPDWVKPSFVFFDI